jgi:hypothetical protein
MPAGKRIVPALAGAGTLEGPMQLLKIDLDGLRYKSGHFNIRSSTVENAVWQFMLRPENVIRMEAVTAVERPAVEAMSRPLVWKFGRDIAQPCIKQMVGHMYLPTGATTFASRKAHDLTYRSVQESGWRKRSEKFRRRLARRLAGNP